MRALVTGGGGFIGSRLCAALAEEGHDVFSADRRRSDDPAHIHIDLADGASLRSALERAVPDVVFHLAAQAFVPRANREPLETYETNVLGTARLFEAIAGVSGERRPPRVLHVSSAEVYGPRDPSEYPLREDLAPRPATPYAASKLGSEAVALAATHTHRIPTIIARGFNQIGPGQDPRFAIPSFASQLAEIAAGVQPVMFVGNLETQRDFLDVRDAVRAYVKLALAGQPGEIYNVCSGRPVSVKEVLRQLIMVARVSVEVREDPARMRPSDVPLSYGDNAKLRAQIDWSPQCPLADSLQNIYADARSRLEVSRG